jgi:hypothetical protein
MNTFYILALGLFLQVVHVHVEPCVSVAHPVHLVINKGLAVLATVAAYRVDVNKSCHNFFVLIVIVFV